MKKLLTFLTLIFIVGFLSACGTENSKAEDDVDNNETTTEPTSTEEVAPTTTFKDGTLETDAFSLAISKTEIIQSPMEDNPGLFVTFKLTNNTKDQDVVPSDTLGYLMAQQENDTSRVELQSNYYFLDAFGGTDDVEKYNEMVKISNSSSDALLPGKTIEFVEAYQLDNEQHDVTFIGIDAVTSEEVGKYTVKLK